MPDDKNNKKVPPTVPVPSLPTSTGPTNERELEKADT